jgi:DNA-binding response OmpR family regulator
LVVEDDVVLADGLKVGLGLHGATLDVVSSCADGQVALAVDAFDAVVLDVMLPDGSGLDLLASLRAKGYRIPVLLLTALDEVSDRIRGLEWEPTIISASPSIWMSLRRGFVRSAVGRKGVRRLRCRITA